MPLLRQTLKRGGVDKQIILFPFLPYTNKINSLRDLPHVCLERAVHIIQIINDLFEYSQYQFNFSLRKLTYKHLLT